ncbi:MAG: DNA mismatch repair protein MutS, partial [Mangrovibacterium sp.]|nr:DNA mismatch repair protein MutS [Mangrovibacterium sp.]
MAQLTPMMQQYLKIHEEVPDTLLFFRLGDFYEMFFDDAIKASRELEITLTGRDCGLEERAPMCGVPYHSAQNYITRLVEKGYKVAICEQVEDPKDSTGIVKREIIRIISPGTIETGKFVESKKNNFLMSVFFEGNILGIASLDVTTGDFLVTEITSTNKSMLLSQLADELAKLTPSEIILNSALFKDVQAMALIEKRFGIMANLYPEKYFNIKNGGQAIKSAFKVFSLGALDLENKSHAVAAVGAMLDYVDETQRRVLNHIKAVRYYKNDDYMILDLSTRRNLELTETIRTLEKTGSLLWVLDKTVTAMGGRTLRRWLESPLLSVSAILNRQNAVAVLYAHPGHFKELKGILSRIYDFERLCGKLSFGTVTPRDLLALKQSIGALPQLKTLIDELNQSEMSSCLLFDGEDLLVDLWELIDKSIDDNAPLSIKDGNVIKKGYNDEIDKYREAAEKGQDWIRDLESRERIRTGIKTLKIKYNRVFGYFFEVTKSYLDQVPEDYIRKQTLTNAERYFTPELKEMETRILGAQDGLLRWETKIFSEIHRLLTEHIWRIQKKAEEVAILDALYSLALVAHKCNYVRPEITKESGITIKNGRHPVVEIFLGEGHFIANDCSLDNEDQKIILITGPNMAGKSTYIRQVAIITLMAQIGSYIPADYGRIGVVDRIFTRVGASDDLASGQSTFMVEMT